MIARTLLAALVPLAFAGCGSDAQAPSARQDQAMNDVAALLDSAGEELDSIDDSALLDAGNASGNASARQ